MVLPSPPSLAIRKRRSALSVCLTVALVVSGSLTLLVLAAPWLVVLGLFALILPGIFLAIMPTVFLYTLIFSVIWFAVGANNRNLAVPAGLAAGLFVAYAVPSLLNKQTAAWVQQANSLNRAAAAQIAHARTIAIHEPARFGQGQCNDVCQLLLYNGAAERVVMVPGDAPEIKKSRTPAKPMAFRINRQTGCSVTADAPKLAGSGWAWGTQSDEIAKSVRLRIATGECLIGEPATSAASDATIRRIEETIGSKTGRLTLWPGSVDVRGVEVKVADRVVARDTVLKESSFHIPLYVKFASSGMERQWWEWGRSSTNQSAPEPSMSALDILKRLENFDLSTPKGVDISVIRRQIDEALNDPSTSNGAFMLAGDYYGALQTDKPGTADFRRLARMIGDERLTDFSYFRANARKLADAGVDLRDPILGRLLRQAESGVPLDYGLVDIAANLPTGAYRGSAPLLDALLTATKADVQAPRLIPRYADQGAAGAAKLWAIVRPKFDVNGGGPSRRWDRYADAALEGLCRLGVDARVILPEMRELSARKAGNLGRPGLLESDPWRKTMVALGADATEFSPPSRNWKDAGKYQEHLRTLARACAAPDR